MPRKRGNNFFYLLAGLLVLLVSGPATEELMPVMGPVVGQFTFSLTILIGLWSLMKDKAWFWVGMVLAISSAVSAAISITLSSTWLPYVPLTVMLVFLLISTGIAGREVLFRGPINLNNLVGAVCIYLLLGLIWAVLYDLLHLAEADSFSGIRGESWEYELSEYVHFSFVTLTTLGYGDITPTTSTARILAYLQAVVGQFYIAILVASLVSIHIATRLAAQEIEGDKEG